jgi:hypothetical protein
MFSQRHFLRLSAIIAATITIAQLFRIAAAFNRTNFRGNVHWTTWLLEIVSIVLCFVLASRLNDSDRSLSRAIRVYAWLGIFLLFMLGATPTPGRWPWIPGGLRDYGPQQPQPSAPSR